MPNESRPLQEPPGSMLSRSNRIKRKKPREHQLGEGLDCECTPTSSTTIQQWSPSLKQQRLVSKGKENDNGQFVLGRRPRRRRGPGAGVSWDHLPDELLLKVLIYLPLQDLVKISAVCKRWHRLAFDNYLWSSVDLEGSIRMGPALQKLLKVGVCRLRCPRSCVEELRFADVGPLQITHLDLSSCIIPTSALDSIISHCRLLQCVSLEGLQLSDTTIDSLANNCKLQQLNLGGCSGFSAPALADMLKSCCSVQQLNISWCDFKSDHVKSVVNNVSPSVTHLNLSGYRERLVLDDVKVLVERCPHLLTLDLSDSTLLTAESFSVLKRLTTVQHLSLSRCYHIHLAAFTDLGNIFPALGLLDVFGLMQDSHLPALQKEMPHVRINSRPFSDIARPTPATKPVGSLSDLHMWSRRCRLRFRL